jgi:hypothetical protein
MRRGWQETVSTVFLESADKPLKRLKIVGASTPG